MVLLMDIWLLYMVIKCVIQQSGICVLVNICCIVHSQAAGSYINVYDCFYWTTPLNILMPGLVGSHVTEQGRHQHQAYLIVFFDEDLINIIVTYLSCG